jgi:HAD superfamily hydrolase (TIGR01490 family)
VRGYSEEEAQVVWDWVVNEFVKGVWRMDIREILREHQVIGDEVILVSAGPQSLLAEIAKSIGVEHAIGTRFEVKDGRFTGKSLQPVCIDEFKASLSSDYLAQKKLAVDLAQSYAYADSITDLALLEMVGNPAAVYPDQELSKIAQQRNWRVIT